MADDPDIEIEAIELETTMDESDSAENQPEINDDIEIQLEQEEKEELDEDPDLRESSSPSASSTTTTTKNTRDATNTNNDTDSRKSNNNNDSNEKSGFYNRPWMFSFSSFFFSKHPFKKRLRLFLMEFEEYLFLLLAILVLSLLFAIVIVLVGVINWSSRSLLINEFETINSGLGSSSSSRWFECIEAQGLAKNNVTLMRFETEPPLNEETEINFVKDVSLYPATMYFYRHFHLRQGDRGGVQWVFTAPVSYYLLREKEWNLFQAGRPVAATSTNPKSSSDFNITVTDNYFFVFKGSGSIGGARNGRIRFFATTRSYDISNPVQVITRDDEGCCLPFNSAQVCLFVGPSNDTNQQQQSTVVNTEISYRITKRLWFTVSILSTMYLACILMMSLIWKFCITRSTQQSINQKVSDITSAVVHGNTGEIIRELQDVTTPARERPSRRLLVEEEDEEDPHPHPDVDVDVDDGDHHHNIGNNDEDGEGAGMGAGVTIGEDEEDEGRGVALDISDTVDEREY